MQAAIGATATGPTCPTAQRAAPARASAASAGLRPASLPDARRFLSGVQLLRTRASARRNAASRRTIVKAAAEGADQLNAMFEVRVPSPHAAVLLPHPCSWYRK